MLYIHYNQTKPNQASFEYAIQGNNNVDVVCFDIKEIELGFEPTHIYVKVQSKDKKYIDKIELTESNGVLNWHLLAKTTRHKVVSVQLSFETNTQYFQTEMVELTLKPYINAEEEMENDYPMVLQDLQRQIDEMSGGGGASSVEIEKIWLTYDDKKSIRTDYLGAYDDEGNPFVNDSTRIFVNFKTTPIGAKIENEIKNGRFVIRLDYPMKSRNIKLNYLEGGSIWYRQPQNDYGIGARSYCHTFKKYQGEWTRNPKKNEILKRSLIFIEPSDIKLNRYGEKYIHKKISLFQYISNICEIKDLVLYPITNEKIQEGQELNDLFNYVDSTFQIGIPTLNQNGNTNNPMFSGSFVYKCYSRGNGYLPNIHDVGRVNGKKINPAFTCYTPLYTKNHLTILSLVSPYWNNHHNKMIYQPKFNEELEHGSDFYTMFPKDKETMSQNNSKRNFMVAKPRCAILNEDWENADYSFLKTFPQATQDIKLVCKAIRDVDDYGVDLMPIFRIKIGAK